MRFCLGRSTHRFQRYDKTRYIRKKRILHGTTIIVKSIDNDIVRRASNPF